MKNFLNFIFYNIFIFSFNLNAIDLDQLVLEEGFSISIFAENLDSPRQMVEGKNGTIFVGERNGKILALRDSDNNGRVDSKIIVADGLTFSTGVSLFNGDLYFSEISKIWKIENIENWITNYSINSKLPEKILVVDNLPDDKWHGWKWLKHDKSGSLYFNIVAPCNICLSENPQFASILKYKDGKMSADDYRKKSKTLVDRNKEINARLDAIKKEKEEIALKEKLDKREVAKTMMEKDTHMAILEIIKEYGISLREGSQGVKAYYEIAKTAYQEGFMAGLHKIN